MRFPTRFTVRLLTVPIAVIACSLTTLDAQDRATRVRNDRKDILAGGHWIYNDLERGFEEAREASKPIPDKVLHPWPLPEVFGMYLDPRARARVSRVDAGSVAERAGFRAGDELVSLQGQSLVSIADLEWVLHHAGEGVRLAAQVRRGDEEFALDIPLEPGWRKGSDISWRVSTWELRRMGTGGMLIEDLPPDDRRRAGISPDRLALVVKHVGEYGEHATAKKAGVKKGDTIVAVDGQTGHMRETDFISYAVQKKMPGERLELTVLRDGERQSLTFAVK